MKNGFDGSWGDALETGLPLDQFGAPGFSLRERLDFSGHGNGRVTPHLNAELFNGDRVLGRDLANTQLPGFNGMQAL
ncbi:MAG: hypothetical protein WCK89_05455 [bacterium]